MITKLEILSFRNIKHSVLEFKDNTSIIAGENGLGKSNTLSAIMWILSDAIITDSGNNESDINSIVPKDFARGADPEVSIWINETKFTKVYKATFKRGTDAVNGHTSEYSVNDVKQANQKDFNEALYKALKFEPKLKKFNANEEMKLYMDPLRALSKIKTEQLRELLISLGCGVSNEEIYALGFEDLRKYENKYQGEFKAMKTDMKKQMLAVEKDKAVKTQMLSNYVGAEEFDPSNLNKYQGERDSLIIKKKELVVGGTNEQVKEIDLQIKDLENQKDNALSLEYSKIANQIEALKNQQRNLLDRADLEKEKMLQPLKDAATKNKAKLDDLKRQAAIINANVENASNTLLTKAKQGNEEQARKKILLNRLDSLNSREFSNFVKCPSCGAEFAPDPKALEEFNKQKETDIADCKSDIEHSNNTIKSLLEECNSYNKLKQDGLKELDSLNLQIKEFELKQIELDKDLITKSNEQTENLQVAALEKEISTLNSKRNLVESEIGSKFDAQIIELRSHKQELINGNNAKNFEQIQTLDAQITELNALIDNEYASKSAWENLVKCHAEIERLNKIYNDYEYLYNRSNEFCKTMTSMLNSKASKKFGINFVMQEQNLTNDDTKDVCYVTVNGVPFKNVNTSEVIHTGVQFISKLREIVAQEYSVQVNDLPILADRLEALDDIEKCKTWSKHQMIVTKPEKGLKNIVVE